MKLCHTLNESIFSELFHQHIQAVAEPLVWMYNPFCLLAGRNGHNTIWLSPRESACFSDFDVTITLTNM